MAKIFIDENELQVEDGITIFNAAKEAGIEIPHLCYHPAFIPEGTCRMCLVEIEGLPKLELACSTLVRDGMKVSTKSERVVEARQGVLEFLLADHPLDCPICDQAGDCKLQDYYETYGLFDSRFNEEKERTAKKREIGKNLIHDQERCVLCRRCVRFTREITKTRELGVFERGAHTEVDIIDGSPVDNNYSGNLAQLCPVGAITDSDFRFQTRNWFLKSGDSICPLCSRGCSITVDSHKGFSRFPTPKRVYRIQARKNEKVNGFWICDLGRYGYSYLNENRLTILPSKNGKRLQWDEVLQTIAVRLKELHTENKQSQVALCLSSWLTNEELFLIKKLFIEILEIPNISCLEPPNGEGDDFLLTAERSPNKRGLMELGLPSKPFAAKDIPKKLDLFLFFCPPLVDTSRLSDIQTAFDRAETSVCFSAHENEVNTRADILLPTALIAEKGGSLTNCEGLAQGFSPALEALGDSRPEWKLLVEIAKRINIQFKYFEQFSSPEAILDGMRKEMPDFGKKSD